MPSPRTAESARKSSTKRATKQPDAVQLLRSDHREVEGWFEQFAKSRSDDRKAKLAAQICSALRVHTTIEEEIFYPAFIKATDDQDLFDEAHVEHEGAKRLIAEIEQGKPGDDKWDAKVSVLSEMIKHHVKEEEQRDGMFAKAKEAQMDLAELGAEMGERKKALTAARTPKM